MYASSPGSPFLIVDDDATQRSLTRMLLGAAGVSAPVVECEGGPEALAHLTSSLEKSRTLPAVVFLDLAMPSIDGIGVLRWLRAHPLLASLRVVVLTSSTAQSDRDLCAELGAQAYLVKHPAPSLLLKTLEAIGLPAVGPTAS